MAEFNIVDGNLLILEGRVALRAHTSTGLGLLGRVEIAFRMTFRAGFPVHLVTLEAEIHTRPIGHGLKFIVGDVSMTIRALSSHAL
jgi:hypothetical protein